MARPQPREALDRRAVRSAARSHSGLGYGTTKLEFSTDQSNYLNKSDQVYKDSVAYQKLFGGEAMVTLVTMDPGHTVAELFTADGVKQWQAIADRINASHQVLDVVSPLTALQWNDNLVQRPEGRRHPERRGQDPRRRPRTREVEGGARGTQCVGARDHHAHQHDSRRATDDRQPEVSRLLALRQPVGNDKKPIRTAAPRGLPRRPPRADGRAPARQRVDQGGGQGGRLRDRRTRRSLHFAHAQIITTGAPGAAREPEQLPHGRDDDARVDRDRGHDVDPAALFSVRWRLLADGHRAHRRDLGVRPRRLSRHPAHDRHHLRAPRDARHRDRLRDPDARARRGRGRHRPRRRTRSRRRPATSAPRCSSSPSTPSSRSRRCTTPRFRCCASSGCC